MDKLEKAKRLKGMLSQIAGRQGLESIASASARASGGLESISPERTNVQSASKSSRTIAIRTSHRTRCSASRRS